ncbi:polysaccharide biosynthesis tyrosine autokinase [Terrabacter aerolatus]|uniref:non-specific protein-tyrosine kinase n=1 Tax=Terrabacter aerolatus TaxID=422442 RepID=A0A512CZP1_9MICO|nr:polysaccharide biosynthesis tyrosine autokinase [Terrabacter aerolatus]GEO29681.1 chromosome partitioning protein [Terrabacter aerolatus]
MELQDYLNVIRKRWMIIAAVTLVTLGLAAAYTALSPRTYSSSTRFFVQTTSDDTTSSLAQGNTFTQARVKTYAQILTDPTVLQPVIDSVRLSSTTDQLAGRVTSSIPLDTGLIDVTVTDSSPQRAQQIAKAIGEVFPPYVAKIETRSGKTSPVQLSVTRPATFEPAPVSPKPTRNLALGLVLGLLLGFGMALLRDVLDKSVKSQRDLETVTDRTILGGIAYDTDASVHPLIVQVDPRSQRAEAFRSLRTNLQFIDVSNPPKSIVVTSSLPGEGKSTTTANLAISLAETGLKVVVIEGDLRRPRLLDYLGFEGSVGLTDVLVGRVEVDDVLQPFGRTGLRLLGAGPIPPNPSELLGSANMEQLIEDLTERFDYVLIDAPPLLPVTDAAVLSTIVDGALVVVGAGVVQREHVRRAIDSLDAVNGSVLGLILNRVKAKEGGAGYGTYEYDYRPESERQRAKGRSMPPQRRPIANEDDMGPVNPRMSAPGSRPGAVGPETPEQQSNGHATAHYAGDPAQRADFPAGDSIFR